MCVCMHIRVVLTPLKTACRMRRLTSALRGRTILALLGNFGRQAAAGAGGGGGVGLTSMMIVRIVWLREWSCHPTGGSTGSFQFLRRGLLGRNWGNLLDFAPISRRILAAWRGWGISGILGQFWCAVIGTPIFFCFNHRSCNAAHPTALRIRCASAAHPLPPFSRG